MRGSLKKGLGFGLTSGVITTLGLIVGLFSTTHSKLVVIGGIVVIAVADALSDAMGMHISQECDTKNTTKQIWESTLSTFLSKFIIALTFIIPILILSLSTAIIVSVVWGLLLIAGFSYYISKKEKIKAWKVILEHLGLAIIVIIITHFVGLWISTLI